MVYNKVMLSLKYLAYVLKGLKNFITRLFSLKYNANNSTLYIYNLGSEKHTRIENILTKQLKITEIQII